LPQLEIAKLGAFLQNWISVLGFIAKSCNSIHVTCCICAIVHDNTHWWGVLCIIRKEREALPVWV